MLKGKTKQNIISPDIRLTNTSFSKTKDCILKSKDEHTFLHIFGAKYYRSEN